MNSKDFTDVYDRVDADAVRYAVLHRRVRVDRKAIEERVGKVRTQSIGRG